MAVELGLSSESAFYQWFKTPGFCAWWLEAAETFWARKVTRLYGLLYEHATGQISGVNIKAIQVLLQRFDEKYERRSTMRHEGAVTHTVEAGASMDPLLTYLGGITEDECRRILDTTSSAKQKGKRKG
jgi:hypothetical protein